jgi:cell division protein FtsW
MLLLTLGLIVIYSSSSVLAQKEMGDSYYFLKRQGAYALVGIFLMMIAKNMPLGFYKKMVYPFLFFNLLMLVIVLVPGIGVKIGGARRWLRFFGISFQPSELAKLCLSMYMAYSMSRKVHKMDLFSRGILPHLIIAGSFIGLILLQPDLGTSVIIAGWILLLLFIGGARLWQIVSMVFLSIPLLIYSIFGATYRLKRWWAFLNPWDDPQGVGFQIVHSYLAFGSGGLWGVGLGNSKQKLFYLPEPHTDFILSIIGEELGFIGIMFVVVLFVVLILRGIKIALNCRDLFGCYLALGITCFLSIQVLINMGVVMGLLPTKGLTLPLLSYGGSSLVMTLISVGVLLNISSGGRWSGKKGRVK